MVPLNRKVGAVQLVLQVLQLVLQLAVQLVLQVKSGYGGPRFSNQRQAQGKAMVKAKTPGAG